MSTETTEYSLPGTSRLFGQLFVQQASKKRQSSAWLSLCEVYPHHKGASYAESVSISLRNHGEVTRIDDSTLQMVSCAMLWCFHCCLFYSLWRSTDELLFRRRCINLYMQWPLLDMISHTEYSNEFYRNDIWCRTFRQNHGETVTHGPSHRHKLTHCWLVMPYGGIDLG